ncbi:hypothetical protein FF36_06385, partial [Frankia torreyi]
SYTQATPDQHHAQPPSRTRAPHLTPVNFEDPDFFDHYNNHHRHSGIGLLTPTAVHHGQAAAVHQARAAVLDNATHPERFVRRPPTPPALPQPAWINRPPDPEDQPDTTTG